MDLSKIKNLIKKNGDKFILVENDVPEIVMISFQEYEKLTEARLPDGQESRSASHSEPCPKRDENTSELEETEFVIPLGPTEPRPAKPVRLEDINLEDLPL